MTALEGALLREALSLLQRLQAGGGLRELMALSVRIDGWLPAPLPIVLPDGRAWPEPGHPLPWPDGSRRWLLAEARLLDPSEGAKAGEPRVLPILELEAEAATLAAALRMALIEAYLAGLALADLEGQALRQALSELLALSRASDPTTRGLLLAALRQTMAERRADWGPIAAHLRSGFETALADRDPDCFEPAVGALIELATLGPFPPPEAGDPLRILDVLLRVPRAGVRAATLRAIARLPRSLLDRVAAQVTEHARDDLAHEDAEVRRAAGELELRLASLEEEEVSSGAGVGSGPTIPALLEELDSDSAFRRARALRQVGDRARDLPMLLPRMLEALDDSDAEVRAAAGEAVRPLLGARSAAVRRRVQAALLRSRDSVVVRVGLEALGRPPFPIGNDVAEPLLQAALDGPEGAREPTALLLTALYAEQPMAEAARGYGSLLRHADPLVRMVALRALGRDAVERPRLRDALTHELSGRLEDPEPMLRAAALHTHAALGHPGALDMASRLAGDPDPIVRQGALELLRQAGGAELLARGEAIAADVSALYDLAHEGGGDARIRWSRALADLVLEEPQDLPRILLGVLRQVPPDTAEPFLRFVIGEVDRELLKVADRAPEGLAGLCRRLVEPPNPRPEHAARLAAAGAAEEPQLFDLLWTMATVGGGTVSESARRALSGLQGRRISDGVRAMAAEAWTSADDGERAVLRTLLGRAPR